MLPGRALALATLAAAPVVGHVVSGHSAVASSRHATHMARAASARTIRRSGTLAAINRHSGRTVLTLRSTAGSLLQVAVSSGGNVITNDDRSAPLSLLRVGDAIQVSASGTVRDRSLHHITLSGVVAIEPGVDGSALIMTDGRTNQVIVDVSSSTSYRDTSRQTDSLDDLSVGDMLHVNGIADGTLGEVTLTQSLTRVGPVRHAGTSHS